MSDTGTRRLGSAKGTPAANKGARLPAEPLTVAEVQALIAACSSRAPTGIRNRALIAVMWRGGLRVSDALGLKVSDVDPERGTVRILHGKGDKPRTVGLDPGAMALVQRWTTARRDAGIRTVPLFCTLQGRKLNDRYVRDLLPRLAAKAGIEKRVHPHGLRHTHAAELVSEGVPLTVIRDQLGHTSLAVTDRYLRGIAPGEVIKTMQERRWDAPD